MILDKINIQVQLKRLCLLPIFSFFVLLLTQQVLQFQNVKPLGGDIDPIKYICFSKESWLSGNYQENTSDFLNENFGFRNSFVRFNNQLELSLFNKANGKGIVVGKENYLYEADYISAYLGNDFLGEQSISDTLANLKFLQETLRSLGKTLLIVVAPNKARVYPEYLPYDLPREEVASNYSAFTKGFLDSGINYIDFNQIFLQKKNIEFFPLFSQFGVHWSRLEAVRAADTILGKLVQLSGANLPRINITSIEKKDSLEFPDNDIIEGMNILSYPEYKKMGYPKIEYVVGGKEKKNVLVIADSYWWDIYLRGIPRNVFEINNFWYYNQQASGNNFLGKRSVSQEDLKRVLLQNDIIIILNSENNLAKLGFGFIGAATEAIKRPIFPSQSELEDLKDIIKKNLRWMTDINTKAKNKKISIDSMITLDANWFFQQKGPIIKKITFEEVKNSMLANSDLLIQLEKKAKFRNISLDSMLYENTMWYFKHELSSKEREAKKITFDELKTQIKNNSKWMEDIKAKAKQKNISIDSSLTLDAYWYFEEQSK